LETFSSGRDSGRLLATPAYEPGKIDLTSSTTIYALSPCGEQAADNFRGRLENVSNQWMLATVASLDHQSREVVSGIAATPKKSSATPAPVFSEIGDSLRERLTQIASNLNITPHQSPLTPFGLIRLGCSSGSP